MIDNIKKGAAPFLCVGLSAIHKANFIYAAAADLDRPLLVLTQDDLAAARLAADLNGMAGKEDFATVFPARDYSYRQMESISGEYEQQRLGVLSRILQGQLPVTVASAQAASSRTAAREALRQASFTVGAGPDQNGIPNMQALISRLSAAGYARRPQVDGVSQFAVRGGILDLFPPGEPNPVRIEYWGDEIDTITYFELDSQRRTDPLSALSISPAGEVLFGEGELKEKLRALLASLGRRKQTAAAREKLEKDLEKLDAGMELESLDKYFPLTGRFTTLLDYFPENTPVFLSEYIDLKETLRAQWAQHQEDLKLLFEEGELCRGLDSFYLSPEQLEGALSGRAEIYLETFAHGGFGELRDVINLSPLQNSGWNGDLKLLKSDLDPLLEQGYCCCVLAGTDKAAQNLAADLARMGLPASYEKDLKAIRYRKVAVLAGTLSTGFEYPEIRFSLTTTARAYTLPQKKPKKRKGEEIRSLSDLSPGDYVVHVTHGIGVFDGIHKLELQGVVKDYIKIKYAGSDILYVPVTQLDLVSKYIGPREDAHVKLNRLHSAEWQKTRQRVKKAVDEMADELIALYARRMSVKGYAFSPDDELQRDFEEHFEYQETDDQLRCIREIKDDMEKPVPMERLLCGDVGFGKTEVALRAAFKCVLDGKQCAILCPTTILAWQHY